MIEAVVKNKLKPDEDCLTSTVWGLLKYRFLRPILARFLARATLVTDNKVHLGDLIPESSLNDGQLEIRFWHKYPIFGEPDILIIGEDFALAVEAKYGADLSGADQLRKYGRLLNEEYRSKKIRYVIYLTADWVTPRISKHETAGIEKTLWWLSWHELSGVVDEFPNRNPITGEVRGDLIRFLDHLYLGFYRGLSKPSIDLYDDLFWRGRVPIFSQYELSQPVRRYFWKEDL